MYRVCSFDDPMKSALSAVRSNIRRYRVTVREYHTPYWYW